VHSDPRYGELIDLLSDFEGRPNLTDLLCSEIQKRYPNTSVSRPTRLYDTVIRIAAPTRPSLSRPAKLEDHLWQAIERGFGDLASQGPLKLQVTLYILFNLLHIISFVYTVHAAIFPEELLKQGLTEELLLSTLNKVQARNSQLWELSRIPSIGFYRALHTYLRRQPRTTKILIGKFFAIIDFEERIAGLTIFFNLLSALYHLKDQWCMIHK